MDNYKIIEENKLNVSFNSDELIAMHGNYNIDILKYISEDNSKEVYYDLLKEALKEITSLRNELKEIDEAYKDLKDSVEHDINIRR
jgi:hypothetical protein